MENEVYGIKKGDLLFEYSPSFEVAFEALEDVQKTHDPEDGDCYSFKAKSLNSGREITIGWIEKYSHYGPKIYTRRAYCTKNSAEVTELIKDHPRYKPKT